MGDVRTLGTGRRLGDPVTDVVEVLEMLLGRAQRGEITALVAGVVNSDGSTATSHAWEKGVDSGPIIAASTISHERTLRALVQDH